MSKEQAIQFLIQERQEILPANFQQKLAQLRRLNELWHKYMDLTLTKHTRVANWRDGHLIIEVDGANWATHIRYMIPDLLNKLKKEKELSELKKINWYIKPSQADSRKDNFNKMQPLSAENSQMMIEIAEHLSNDQLKKALQKLARHVKQDENS